MTKIADRELEVSDFAEGYKLGYAIATKKIIDVISENPNVHEATPSRMGIIAQKRAELANK